MWCDCLGGEGGEEGHNITFSHDLTSAFVSLSNTLQPIKHLLEVTSDWEAINPLSSGISGSHGSKYESDCLPKRR
jgi:hypothetical protein